MTSNILRLRRAWWALGLLIAGSALAFLGLKAIRVDRLEQQAQVARLADAAIGNVLDRVVTELDSVGDELNIKSIRVSSEDRELLTFIVDGDGTISFPQYRVYFAETGKAPRSVRTAFELSSSLSDLARQAQTTEAQQRRTDAIELYRRASQSPLLNDWAEWNLARLENGNATDSHRWGRAEGYAPSGLPVALLASSGIEQADRDDRAQFAHLIDQTFWSLRENRWWLSYDQRRFYNGQLQEWLHEAGDSVIHGEDGTVEELPALERAIRSALRNGRDRKPRFESAGDEGFLLVWESIQRRPNIAIGAAITEPTLATLLDVTLQNLTARQSFLMEARRADGSPLAQRPLDMAHSWRTQEIKAAAGLFLAFTEPDDSALNRRTRRMYVMVLFATILLFAGLTMTIRALRSSQ